MVFVPKRVIILKERVSFVDSGDFLEALEGLVVSIGLAVELADVEEHQMVFFRGYCLPFIMIDNIRTYYCTYRIWASRLIS